MNTRQLVNRNPSIMAVVVLLVIGLSGWVIWTQTASGSSVDASKVAHFTIDDGKTWFTDDVAKLPPFDKDGKQAVRAVLFKCGDAEPVVGYLERYTAKGKEITERYRAEQKANPGVPPKSLGEMAGLGRNATEVKKPGTAAWTSKGQGVGIMKVTCSNSAEAVTVIP